MTDVNPNWLKLGTHWDLNIEHKRMEDAGPFTGGGNKLVWHTVESPREFVDQAWNILNAKRASPHFIVGWRKGFRYPVVIQCVPLNRAARTLEHPFGPETNRANCIQIEVCGRAATASTWSMNWLKALANLSLMIEHRVKIPRTRPRMFAPVPHRYGAATFVKVAGHVGHQHVPNQPSGHWDPGAFWCRRMLRYMDSAPNELKPR